jgi:dTDP-4-amino-4,6-dideoxygalactose transaminase
VYYPVPLHRQPCFQALAEPAMPVSEAATTTALALPFHPALSDEAQTHVLGAVTRFFA